MAARDPGLREVAGMSLLYSSEPYSCTVPTCQETLLVRAEWLVTRMQQAKKKYIPIPKSLMIRGGPSKAHNMTVIRPFSRICEMVSTPADITFGVSQSGLAAAVRALITAATEVLIPDLL